VGEVVCTVVVQASKREVVQVVVQGKLGNLLKYGK